MISIIHLFGTVIAYLAQITMLLPIFSAIYARRKKSTFTLDFRIFEIYVYVTFFFQMLALTLSMGFGLHNVWLFRIYLPLHTILFSYYLLKWSGLKKNYILIPFIIGLLSFLGDYFWGNLILPQIL